MSKIFGKKSKTILATTALLSTVAGIFALQTPIYAQADERKDTLIAPTSYEQFLSLHEPTALAVSENYTAIADGNKLYVYDRKANAYDFYEHGDETNPQSHVKKLQFDENETLYFLDGSTSTNFYAFNVETKEETRLDLACGTFLIHDDDLYFTNAQKQLHYANLTDDELTSTFLRYEAVSSLAFWNDELYFIQAELNLNKINPHANGQSTATHVKLFDGNITSIAITNGVLSCTDTNGSFSAYTLPCRDETPASFIQENGGFSTLSAFGEHVYAVKTEQSVIKEYSTTDNAFTSFEICANSDAYNRLHDASNVLLSGKNLWITDNGNARVSLYNTKTETFTGNFPIDFSPKFLSADTKTLLLSDDDRVSIYDITNENFGAKLSDFTDFDGEITGVTNVYGKYYLTTKDNYFYCFTKTEANVYETVQTHKISTRTPTSLTADAYGNLYIKSGTSVFVFTETEFMQENAFGTEFFTRLPTETTSFLIDYEKNVYALSENKIYVNDNVDPIDFSTPLVYEDSVTINAFAFGIEENRAFLLCGNNHIIQTERLDLPTVKEIETMDVDEEIFSTNSANVSVVQTKENALLIAFDLQSLQDATYFPYLYAKRQTQPQTALKIGESGKYALLAVFNTEKLEYESYLILSSDCEVLETNEFSTPFESAKTAYITNDVTLYKYPYLTELLTVARLQRNAKVQLLGEVNKLDHEYYHISYTDEQGATKSGYIPKSYASVIDGGTPETETVQYGANKSNGDAVWRLAYLLLGFALVCILVDYLILRNKKQ